MKSTGISVHGPKVDREAVEAVSEAIERVLDAGYRNHADQETTRHALSQLGKLGEQHTSISNCDLRMGACP